MLAMALSEYLLLRQRMLLQPFAAPPTFHSHPEEPKIEQYLMLRASRLISQPASNQHLTGTV